MAKSSKARLSRVSGKRTMSRNDTPHPLRGRSVSKKNALMAQSPLPQGERESKVPMSPFFRSGLFVALATVLADQASKLWLLNVFELGPRGTVRVLPFLDLVLAWNTGISYGWFEDSGPVGQTVLLAIKPRPPQIDFNEIDAVLQQTRTLLTRLAFAFTAVLVGAVTWLSISRRRREIGIKRQFGIHIWEVLAELWTEATILCIAGGVAGGAARHFLLNNINNPIASPRGSAGIRARLFPVQNNKQRVAVPADDAQDHRCLSRFSGCRRAELRGYGRGRFLFRDLSFE